MPSSGAKVEDGSAVGWPAWALTDPSIPARMAVDDVTLYNGDAGIAWALAGLVKRWIGES